MVWKLQYEKHCKCFLIESYTVLVLWRPKQWTLTSPPSACFICQVPAYQPPLMLSITMSIMLQPFFFPQPLFHTHSALSTSACTGHQALPGFLFLFLFSFPLTFISQVNFTSSWEPWRSLTRLTFLLTGFSAVCIFFVDHLSQLNVYNFLCNHFLVPASPHKHHIFIEVGTPLEWEGTRWFVGRVVMTFMQTPFSTLYTQVYLVNYTIYNSSVNDSNKVSPQVLV